MKKVLRSFVYKSLICYSLTLNLGELVSFKSACFLGAHNGSGFFNKTLSIAISDGFFVARYSFQFFSTCLILQTIFPKTLVCIRA